MNMSKKPDLLLRLFDTVLHDCRVEPHQDERRKLDAVVEDRTVFGDLLTEAAFLANVAVGWYPDPAEARKQLSPKFFNELFSWAVREEETIRGNREGEDEAIIGAMRDFVDRVRRQKDPDLLAGELNQVWCGRRRGVKVADREGWEGQVPREIVGYIGAARAVMPSVGCGALLDDLLSQHGPELCELEETSWEPDDAFQQAVTAALKALEDKGVEPWAGPIRQESLF